MLAMSASGAGPSESASPPSDLGDYWVGIHGRNVPAALRAHLELPAGGVIVDRVLPGSPAAKANLRPHDLIVAAAGEPLSGAEGLCRAINNSDGEPLALSIVRAGERIELTVAPEPRPSPRRTARAEGARSGSIDPDAARVLDWLRKVRPPGIPGEAQLPPRMRLHFVHPGMILPRGVEVVPSLPPNMRVAISKRGKQPAEITVERDDQSWTVSETELDELPDDLRPHVDRMLGHLPMVAAGQPLLKLAPARRGDSSDTAGESSAPDDSETELFLPAPSVEHLPRK
jgi:membrane-associated protease RseP (regulator of RpoE activity)